MRCLFTANFTVSQWTTTPGWNFTNSKPNIFCFVLVLDYVNNDLLGFILR